MSKEEDDAYLEDLVNDIRFFVGQINFLMELLSNDSSVIASDVSWHLCLILDSFTDSVKRTLSFTKES